MKIKLYNNFHRKEITLLISPDSALGHIGAYNISPRQLKKARGDLCGCVGCTCNKVESHMDNGDHIEFREKDALYFRNER